MKSLVFFFLSLCANAEDLPKLTVESPSLIQFSSQTGAIEPETWALDPLSFGQNYYDTLLKIPGIQTKDESSPSFNLRGSVTNNRVLTLFEDTPITFDVQGPSNLLLAHEITDKLNILKGPASNFFGDFAMSGALHFKTRLFQKQFFDLGGGSFSRRHLLYLTPVGTDSQVHFFYNAAIDNFKYDSGPNFESGKRDNNQKELYRASFYKEKKAGDHGWKALVLGAGRKFTSPGPANSLSKTKGTELGNIVHFSGFNELERSKINYKLYGAFQSNTFEDQSFPTSKYSYLNSGLQLDYDKYFQSFQSQTGLLYGHYEYDFSYDFGTKTSDIYKKDFYELFQSFIIPFSDYTLQPSIRYLLDSNKFISSIHLINEFSTYFWQASYTQGYRNPGYGDKYVDTNNFVSNPDLEPETSYQIEFKLGRQKNSFVNWHIATYFTEYHDLISNFSLGGGRETKKNLNYAQAKGVDIFFSKNLPLLEFSYTASYLEAIEQGGDKLNLSPYFQSRLALAHHWAALKFTLANNFWSQFYDSDFGGSQQKMSGWTTWDFSVSSFAFKSFSVDFSIDNLTNQNQITKINYPQPGRSFYFRLRKFL